MITGFLGTKEEQSQQFTADGQRIPVTTIIAGPCYITRLTGTGVQLGFGTKKNQNQANAGHIKKTGLDKKLRFLREIDVEDLTDATLGKEINVGDVFTAGDTIQVMGISKGKGFAGVVKRHGFKGGPRTHGQSDRERAPGSIGQTTTPGRVYRGKRMAGRMGNDRVTVKGLEVISVDSTKNLLVIKGLVPGAKHGLLVIQKV